MDKAGISNGKSALWGFFITAGCIVNRADFYSEQNVSSRKMDSPPSWAAPFGILRDKQQPDATGRFDMHRMLQYLKVSLNFI